MQPVFRPAGAIRPWYDGAVRRFVTDLVNPVDRIGDCTMRPSQNPSNWTFIGMLETSFPPYPIDAGWLKSRLLAEGHIHPGVNVDMTTGPAFESSAAWLTPLELQFTPDSGLPARMVLKTYKPGWHMSAFGEMFFRRELAALTGFPHLVPVYDAQVDLEAGRAYSLMADIRTSHEIPPYPLPDSFDPAPALPALARLHADWWAHPRLEDRAEFFFYQGGPLVMSHALSPEMVVAQAARRASRLPELAAALGPGFSRSMRAIYARLFAQWASIFNQRLSSGTGITLIHGDFHTWNLALPKNPDSAPVYILDWETFKRGLGAYDLAYWIIFSDAPDLWLAEADLMAGYHQALQEAGVPDYGWQAFLEDYRLSVLCCLFPPLMWGSLERAENALSFFERWDCAAFLEGN